MKGVCRPKWNYSQSFLLNGQHLSFQKDVSMMMAIWPTLDIKVNRKNWLLANLCRCWESYCHSAVFYRLGFFSGFSATAGHDDLWLWKSLPCHFTAQVQYLDLFEKCEVTFFMEYLTCYLIDWRISNGSFKHNITRWLIFTQ